MNFTYLVGIVLTPGDFLLRRFLDFFCGVEYIPPSVIVTYGCSSCTAVAEKFVACTIPPIVIATELVPVPILLTIDCLQK